MDRLEGLDELLAEQRRYYRHIAPNYERYALHHPGGEMLVAALDRFDARGQVLELACGTGIWTERLARTAATVTAVDAASEMLALAAARLGEANDRVKFVQADLFAWRPARPRSYDAVVFGFWLSHVPESRFAGFWALVDDCLSDAGRVFFADDAHRSTEELVYGEGSEVVQRRLHDGSLHRVIKVPHTPAALEARLAELGWSISVHPTDGPFYWGAGGRA